MAEIVARYCRRGDFYDAKIEVDGRAVWGALNTKYETFIRALSSELQQHPDARLLFERTDREGLSPWLAHDSERDHIRDNVERYIAENVGYDRRVLVREPVPQSVRLDIRAGSDTLAESFGDHVYVRFRDDGKIECPVCGRWHASLFEGGAPDGSPLYALQCTCRNGIICWDTTPVGSWVELSTIQLLNVAANRFYLPRSWNRSGSWISHEDLQGQYAQYMKETQDVRE